MEGFILKGISPILNPEIVFMLASMGHGDSLVIADANFPAVSTAKRLARLDGVDATSALTAVLSLLPVDQYLKCPASVMAVVDDPKASPEIYDEFHHILEVAEGKPIEMERLERFAFYERAQQAFGIIATSERRLYGNIIISKGVISSFNSG